MSAPYATVTSLTARTTNMDTNCTWLTPSALFDDLCTKITNCCWTVIQNRKLMPKSSGQKI